MSHFQNKNKVWVSNTLKSNSETLGIIKLLKDIGVFREKPKKRKPKKAAKEDEDSKVVDDEEFLVPPTGGGGGGGGGASVGLLPSSNVTQALQALKSGASGQAQQQYLLEKAKEDAELAIGKYKDISQTQQRPNLGFKPSEPRIEWLEEETGTQFFPEKESVVSEPPQEFREERGGSDIPQNILDIDVTPKVSEEEGVIEDEEETFIPAPPEVAIAEKFKTLADQYGLRSLRKDMSVLELKNYIIDLYLKFNKKAPRTAISKMRKDEVKTAITNLISSQYESIYG